MRVSLRQARSLWRGLMPWSAAFVSVGCAAQPPPILDPGPSVTESARADTSGRRTGGLLKEENKALCDLENDLDQALRGDSLEFDWTTWENHTDVPNELTQLLQAELQPERAARVLDGMDVQVAGDVRDAVRGWSLRHTILSAKEDWPRPCVPAPPFNVERAKDFREQCVGPWYQGLLAQLRGFEEQLAHLEPGGFGQAVATQALAESWVALQRTAVQLPSPARGDYTVRSAYESYRPSVANDSLDDHVRLWIVRAASSAGTWGLIHRRFHAGWQPLESQSLDTFFSALRRAPIPGLERKGLSALSSFSRERLLGAHATLESNLHSVFVSGLTPRQGEQLKRSRLDQRARYALGRYWTTLAVLFRDVDAANGARRLLEDSREPEAQTDRWIAETISRFDEPWRRPVSDRVLESRQSNAPAATIRTRVNQALLGGGLVTSSDLSTLSAAERPCSAQTSTEDQGYVATLQPCVPFPWLP